MDRVRPIVKTRKVGAYLAPTSTLRYITTGCKLLDLVLGGGWPIGRVSNVVGDKSTGKTLLAIEALANFHAKYPKARMRYYEAEAAFDTSYAETLGFPVNKVEFKDDIDTVEDFYEDVVDFLGSLKSDEPAVAILDSLDALSDRAELERDIDKGSYGANKAKKISELMRKLIREVKRKNMLLIIISQVRDNIGVTFGERHTRSGGKALDFYASQILWLSQLKKEVKTVKKIKRPVSIIIRAQCKKNKCGAPFRECEFPILFNYGIDDLRASFDWLESIGRFDDLDFVGSSKKVYSQLMRLPRDEFNEEKDRIDKALSRVWKDVEDSFLVGRSKYGINE